MQRYHLPHLASSPASVHHGVWRLIPCQRRLLRTRWLGSMRTRLLCIAVRLFLSDDHYGKHQRGTENRRDGSGGGISGSRRHTGPTSRAPIRQMVVRGNPG